MKERSKVLAKHVAHQSKSSLLNAIDIVKFNFKSLVRSKMFPIMVAIFFAMVLIATFVFVPYNWGVGLFYIAYLQLPCLIMMGWITYNVMDSVIYKNIRSSGIGTVAFFVAQLATILIIGNILTLIFWPIVWVMAHYGLFIANWADKTSQATTIFNPLSNHTWILILYCAELTIGVTFAFYFIIQFWVTNIKVYYLIVVPTILLSIIFGGVINDYFFKAVGYGGDYIHWITANGDSTQWHYDNKVTEQYYVTEDYYNEVLNDMWTNHGLMIQKNIFPKWMFPFTLFFPFYGVGQFASTAVALNSTWGITYSSASGEVLNVVSDINDITSIVANGANVPSVVEGFNIEWYNWFLVNPFEGSSWAWTLVLIQPYLTIGLYLFIGVSSDVLQKFI